MEQSFSSYLHQASVLVQLHWEFYYSDLYRVVEIFLVPYSPCRETTRLCVKLLMYLLYFIYAYDGDTIFVYPSGMIYSFSYFSCLISSASDSFICVTSDMYSTSLKFTK